MNIYYPALIPFCGYVVSTKYKNTKFHMVSTEFDFIFSTTKASWFGPTNFADNFSNIPTHIRAENIRLTKIIFLKYDLVSSHLCVWIVSSVNPNPISAVLLFRFQMIDSQAAPRCRSWSGANAMPVQYDGLMMMSTLFVAARKS